MHKRNIEAKETNVKTGRIDDGCARYGVGRNTMRELAEEAGAVVRIGKIWLINFDIMDSYMDALSGDN